MNRSVEKFIEVYHGCEFPINVEHICKKLNIDILVTILPKYIKGYYNKENRCIYINSSLNHHAKRFVIAREIRQASYPLLKSNTEKNIFAQELLMPTNEFLKRWEEFIPTQVMSCSYYFDVSPKSVIIKAQRLYDEGLISDYTYKLFTNIFEDVKKL